MTTKRLRTSICAAAILVAAAIAGCGGSVSNGSPSATHAAAKTPPAPATGCGSVQMPAAQDPDGILASLPKSYASNYAGYTTPVRKSNWSDWKPDGPGPYKVGIVWGPISNSFQVDVTDALKQRLQDSPNVSDVIFRPTTQVDIPREIGTLNEFIRDGVDIIILQPQLGAAFIDVVNRAAEAGIPVVTVQSDVQTPNAVNIQNNAYQGSLIAGAQAMRIIGGKGNVLLVHGVVGAPVDTVIQDAFKKVVADCPGVKVAGEIAGNFDIPAAKQQTLQFLATHPQQIDAVLDSAIMASGVMSAFEQTGRSMPVVMDTGPMKGSIGYWLQNRGTYTGAGFASGPAELGKTTASVVLRMLEGQGIKLTDITKSAVNLDESNVEQWGDPAWSMTTPGQPAGPPDNWVTDSYLDPLFNHGSTPK
jgi:ribose transport system substrate-binding protein